MVEGATDGHFNPLARQGQTTFEFAFRMEDEDAVGGEAVDALVRLPFRRLLLFVRLFVTNLK